MKNETTIILSWPFCALPKGQEHERRPTLGGEEMGRTRNFVPATTYLRSFRRSKRTKAAVTAGFNPTEEGRTRRTGGNDPGVFHHLLLAVHPKLIGRPSALKPIGKTEHNKITTSVRITVTLTEPSQFSCLVRTGPNLTLNAASAMNR